MGQGHEKEVWRTGDPLLVEGDDLVDDLDRGAALALRLADLLRVAALVGAEEQNVQHGCCVSDEDGKHSFGVSCHEEDKVERRRRARASARGEEGTASAAYAEKKVDPSLSFSRLPFSLCYCALLTALC